MDIQEGLNMQQYEDNRMYRCPFEGRQLINQLFWGTLYPEKKKHLNFKQKIRMIKPLMEEEITSRTKWRVR